ncbi:MAG: hypothetical protein AAGG80_01335 [Pseudomonadota bacterium]
MPTFTSLGISESQLHEAMRIYFQEVSNQSFYSSSVWLQIDKLINELINTFYNSLEEVFSAKDQSFQTSIEEHKNSLFSHPNLPTLQKQVKELCCKKLEITEKAVLLFDKIITPYISKTTMASLGIQSNELSYEISAFFDACLLKKIDEIAALLDVSEINQDYTNSPIEAILNHYPLENVTKQLISLEYTMSKFIFNLIIASRLTHDEKSKLQEKFKNSELYQQLKQLDELPNDIQKEAAITTWVEACRTYLDELLMPQLLLSFAESSFENALAQFRASYLNLLTQTGRNIVYSLIEQDGKQYVSMQIPVGIDDKGKPYADPCYQRNGDGRPANFVLRSLFHLNKVIDAKGLEAHKLELVYDSFTAACPAPKNKIGSPTSNFLQNLKQTINNVNAQCQVIGWFYPDKVVEWTSLLSPTELFDQFYSWDPQKATQQVILHELAIFFDNFFHDRKTLFGIQSVNTARWVPSSTRDTIQRHYFSGLFQALFNDKAIALHLGDSQFKDLLESIATRRNAIQNWLQLRKETLQPLASPQAELDEAKIKEIEFLLVELKAQRSLMYNLEEQFIGQIKQAWYSENLRILDVDLEQDIKLLCKLLFDENTNQKELNYSIQVPKRILRKLGYINVFNCDDSKDRSSSLAIQGKAAEIYREQHGAYPDVTIESERLKWCDFCNQGALIFEDKYANSFNSAPGIEVHYRDLINGLFPLKLKACAALPKKILLHPSEKMQQIYAILVLEQQKNKQTDTNTFFRVVKISSNQSSSVFNFGKAQLTT